LLATQAVALVEDHVSVAVCPGAIDRGAAVSTTVGNGLTMSVAEALANPKPPWPVHDNV
jgi:hypothetical protein